MVVANAELAQSYIVQARMRLRYSASVIPSYPAVGTMVLSPCGGVAAYRPGSRRLKRLARVGCPDHAPPFLSHAPDRAGDGAGGLL